jgi:hypothetical protein
MKPRLVVLILCASLLAAVQARAKTILPDACGDDKVTFDVNTEKHPPAPAPPAAGKAQIVLIETMNKPMLCFECGSATIRFGMDGTWVGANKGNSYFTLDITPGAHDLCTDWQSIFGSLKQKIGTTSFTAESGKVYYFVAKVKFKVYGQGEGTGPGANIARHLKFSQLSDDDGQYRVKASELATWTTSK